MLIVRHENALQKDTFELTKTAEAHFKTSTEKTKAMALRGDETIRSKIILTNHATQSVISSDPHGVLDNTKQAAEITFLRAVGYT